MNLKELMLGILINPSWTGIQKNDYMVLAANISGAGTPVENYAVVQVGIESIEAPLNPTTQERTFMRAGTTSTKNSNKTEYGVTGVRIVGDEWQDYCASIELQYGTGTEIVTDYVYFNMINGVGKKGKASVIVNAVDGGAAGDDSKIDVNVSNYGSNPVAYNWEQIDMADLTVTSKPGATSGETIIMASPVVPTGMKALYETGSSVTVPTFNDTAPAGWTAFTNGDSYTATSGEDFAVIYVDSTNKVKCAGTVKVTAAI